MLDDRDKNSEAVGVAKNKKGGQFIDIAAWVMLRWRRITKQRHEHEIDEEKESRLRTDRIGVWKYGVVQRASSAGGQLIRFLDAPSHLYKRVCPSVGPSVGPSVRP